MMITRVIINTSGVVKRIWRSGFCFLISDFAQPARTTYYNDDVNESTDTHLNTSCPTKAFILQCSPDLIRSF